CTREAAFYSRGWPFW
nr:immunoglobulin heavy chain junction region [Macaca mulatta]